MLSRGTLRQSDARLIAAPDGLAVEGRTQRVGRRRSRLCAVVQFLAVTILSAVATLLLLDWLLFGPAGLAFRLPYENDDDSAINKILLAGRYSDAKVLYLGDSRVFHGINPKVVSEACKCGPGYNAASPSMEPAVVRVVAQRLLERLSPSVVVIGVSQWDLSDAATVPAQSATRRLLPAWELAEYGLNVETHEAFREGPSAVWRLYQYRFELQEALVAWVTGHREEETDRGFDVYGGGRRLDRADLEYREEQWFDDFAVKGRQAEQLRGLLADLRARDLRVIVVAPPLHPEFEARVREEVDQFRAAVKRLSAEHGAAFEDWTDPNLGGVKKSDFVDAVHLTESGANRLSRRLGEVIRQRLDQR